MKTIITIHAAKRIRERCITLSEVTQCLINPDKIETENEKTLMYKLSKSKTELLILVCVVTDDSCKIVTVIKTARLSIAIFLD